MKITDDHWLEGVERDPITANQPMNIRRCVVEHFTGGATAKSSIEAMRERGVSAHVVIDRDGTIIQCVPFNRRASHAGKSRWRDPKTGTLYGIANEYAIGIEIANAGDDPGALSWARKQKGFSSIQARHRNGGLMTEWENYPAAQISAVASLTALLVARYHLDDITGHDCIAPERKNDPGPAFPMQNIREACGFTGLPVVHT
jgi:N-acetylmuramoyl-L-alanine amidase